MVLDALESLIAVLRQVTRERVSGRDALLRVRPVLADLLKQEDWLPEEYRQPAPDRFITYMLHSAPDRAFSITSGVFAPGQATQVHDHLTWGLSGVLEGELVETRYRRLDDGSVAGVAELEVAAVVHAPQGEVTHNLPPDEDIHKLDNRSGRQSVTIAVYGAVLADLRRHIVFPDTETVRPFQGQAAS
ncbi:MAG: hypothetical protein HYY85_10450 [Deltaproteobacteria bacterium]|nr:hypothetical protein [Deltaproteobacteria bacterium]